MFKRSYSSHSEDLTLTIRKDYNDNDTSTPIINTKQKKLIVDYSSSKVEHFLVHEKPYQQLSDHFGLSVSLKFE